MRRDLHQLHDRLFRKVFSEPAEAAGLLRAHVPPWLADTLDWSSLTLLNDSYVDDDLRASESGLLFAIEHRGGVAESGDARRSLRLYLLFEHRSRPDRWMRFRLLKYCCRIWDDCVRSDREDDLPPIVPVVLYLGASGWRHATEFSDLFAEPYRRWPWTPQFKHVLVDQSQADVEAVQGEPLGRMAQLALMAAASREVRAELEMKVWGPEGDIETYADGLIQEGRQEGRVATIESFLRAGVEWSIIEQATGIDQEAFESLRQTHASDRES